MKERIDPYNFQLEQRRSFFRRAAPARMSEGLKKQRQQSVPNFFRWELSLADLEAEHLFVRNHRGEYRHTGVGDFQYTDTDFV